jgi:Protein of unknown function (DUF3097)
VAVYAVLMRSRDYGSDVLAQSAAKARTPAPVVEIEENLVVEDPVSGFCGAVVEIDADGVTLEDRFGTRRLFPLEEGAFLLEGRRVTLARPSRARSA